MKVLLEEVFKKVVLFLNQEKLEYIIIGGVAAGVLGEPLGWARKLSDEAEDMRICNELQRLLALK